MLTTPDCLWLVLVTHSGYLWLAASLEGLIIVKIFQLPSKNLDWFGGTFVHFSGRRGCERGRYHDNRPRMIDEQSVPTTKFHDPAGM